LSYRHKGQGDPKFVANYHFVNSGTLATFEFTQLRGGVIVYPAGISLNYQSLWSHLTESVPDETGTYDGDLRHK
jgi:hypothetical protein